MSDALANIEAKYEVLGKIKEGGMGAIYMVRHRLLGETRVIKVLRPQLDDQAEFHTRFLREARTDHERTSRQRQIDATDREIDQLVCELYGLGDGEFRIVEGAGAPSR